MDDKPNQQRRDWRKIHHSPLFWLASFLFLAAAAVYVFSVDLSWRPRIYHLGAP